MNIATKCKERLQSSECAHIHIAAGVHISVDTEPEQW